MNFHTVSPWPKRIAVGLGVLVLAATLATSSRAASEVPVSDANWFFSPYNWYREGTSFAQSNNVGAYFKVGFTGTSCRINLDVAQLVGLKPEEYPTVLWQMDGGAPQSAQLKSDTTSLEVLSGGKKGRHTLQLWFKGHGNDAVNRWNFATPQLAIRVTGLTLDTKARTIKPAGAIALQPKRVLVYGDSITQSQYDTNDSTLAWPAALGPAFQAEVGRVAFSGQGWTKGPTGGSAPFTQTWNFHDSVHSRLEKGALVPAPDYIVVNHGTNDGWNGSTDAQVQAAVQNFLTGARAAAPGAHIFVVIPFGQFRAAPIIAGVKTQADSKTHLIDLGEAGSKGLKGGGKTEQSNDGIHPNLATHARLGALIAEAMAAALRLDNAKAVTPIR